MKECTIAKPTVVNDHYHATPIYILVDIDVLLYRCLVIYRQV